MLRTRYMLKLTYCNARQLVVYSLARNAATYFGTHGMRDPADIICTMLDYRVIARCRVGGEAHELRREGKQYILVVDDVPQIRFAMPDECLRVHMCPDEKHDYSEIWYVAERKGKYAWYILSIHYRDGKHIVGELFQQPTHSMDLGKMQLVATNANHITLYGRLFDCDKYTPIKYHQGGKIELLDPCGTIICSDMWKHMKAGRMHLLD